VLLITKLIDALVVTITEVKLLTKDCMMLDSLKQTDENTVALNL